MVCTTCCITRAAWPATREASLARLAAWLALSALCTVEVIFHGRGGLLQRAGLLRGAVGQVMAPLAISRLAVRTESAATRISRRIVAILSAN